MPKYNIVKIDDEIVMDVKTDNNASVYQVLPNVTFHDPLGAPCVGEYSNEHVPPVIDLAISSGGERPIEARACDNADIKSTKLVSSVIKDLRADNIRKGTSLFNIKGTYNGYEHISYVPGLEDVSKLIIELELPVESGKTPEVWIIGDFGDGSIIHRIAPQDPVNSGDVFRTIQFPVTHKRHFVEESQHSYARNSAVGIFVFTGGSYNIVRKTSKLVSRPLSKDDDDVELYWRSYKIRFDDRQDIFNSNLNLLLHFREDAYRIVFNLNNHANSQNEGWCLPYLINQYVDEFDETARKLSFQFIRSV